MINILAPIKRICILQWTFSWDRTEPELQFKSICLSKFLCWNPDHQADSIKTGIIRRCLDNRDEASSEDLCPDVRDLLAFKLQEATCKGTKKSSINLLPSLLGPWSWTSKFREITFYRVQAIILGGFAMAAGVDENHFYAWSQAPVEGSNHVSRSPGLPRKACLLSHPADNVFRVLTLPLPWRVRWDLFLRSFAFRMASPWFYLSVSFCLSSEHPSTSSSLTQLPHSTLPAFLSLPSPASL